MERRSLLKALTFTGLASALPFKSLMAAPACDPTTPDILGPYYIPGQPFTSQIAPAGAPGTTMFITGTVYAADCITPLENALVDVWQANHGGQYENNNYRGRINTDASGNYAFTTILPGKYLNGSQYRPRHIHYKVSYPTGQNELVTQVYFEGDASIPTDPWASDPDAAERIIPLVTDGAGDLHGIMDVILNISIGINERDRSHISKGILLGGSPNPFHKSLSIKYMLPAPAEVQINIYDIMGRAVVEEQAGHKDTGDHELRWNGLSDKGIAAPAGIYIVKLFTNGEAVDAKRFLKI